jgi:hypothetical protein
MTTVTTIVRRAKAPLVVSACAGAIYVLFYWWKIESGSANWLLWPSFWWPEWMIVVATALLSFRAGWQVRLSLLASAIGGWLAGILGVLGVLVAGALMVSLGGFEVGDDWAVWVLSLISVGMVVGAAGGLVAGFVIRFRNRASVI